VPFFIGSYLFLGSSRLVNASGNIRTHIRQPNPPAGVALVVTAITGQVNVQPRRHIQAFSIHMAQIIPAQELFHIVGIALMRVYGSNAL
jgi:hypothetical protein